MNCPGNPNTKGNIKTPGTKSTGPNIDIGIGAGNKTKTAKSIKTQRLPLVFLEDLAVIFLMKANLER